MAIKGFETYVPTMNEFIASWNAVNASQGTPLTLSDGNSVSTFTTLKNVVGDAISMASFQSNAEATSSAAYRDARAPIYDRMGEFRRFANYLLSGRDYASRILPLPRITSDDGDFFRVADSLTYAWTMANADASLPATSVPLVLADGTTLAGFQISVLTLRGLQGEISVSAQSAATARKSRDTFCATAVGVMKRYRAAILALYAPDSVEVATLPKLFARTKPAPDAPKLKVEYVAGASKALLLYDIVSDPSLARFYVMISPGARYNARTATRIADLDELVRSYETAEGTLAPGATVWFKVIAVDDDGIEAGSNAVKVTRAA